MARRFQTLSEVGKSHTRQAKCYRHEPVRWRAARCFDHALSEWTFSCLERGGTPAPGAVRDVLTLLEWANPGGEKSVLSRGMVVAAAWPYVLTPAWQPDQVVLHVFFLDDGFLQIRRESSVSRVLEGVQGAALIQLSNIDFNPDIKNLILAGESARSLVRLPDATPIAMESQICVAQLTLERDRISTTQGQAQAQ